MWCMDDYKTQAPCEIGVFEWIVSTAYNAYLSVYISLIYATTFAAKLVKKAIIMLICIIIIHCLIMQI